VDFPTKFPRDVTNEERKKQKREKVSVKRHVIRSGQGGISTPVWGRSGKKRGPTTLPKQREKKCQREQRHIRQEQKQRKGRRKKKGKKEGGRRRAFSGARTASTETFGGGKKKDAGEGTLGKKELRQ